MGMAKKAALKVLLTAGQRTALLAYAKEHGRNWKGDLRADWLRAAARVGGQHSPELQQVRNDFGPAWLYGVSLAAIECGVEGGLS